MWGIRYYLFLNFHIRFWMVDFAFSRFCEKFNWRAEKRLSIFPRYPPSVFHRETIRKIIHSESLAHPPTLSLAPYFSIVLRPHCWLPQTEPILTSLCTNRTNAPNPPPGMSLSPQKSPFLLHSHHSPPPSTIIIWCACRGSDHLITLCFATGTSRSDSLFTLCLHLHKRTLHNTPPECYRNWNNEEYGRMRLGD